MYFKEDADVTDEERKDRREKNRGVREEHPSSLRSLMDNEDTRLLVESVVEADPMQELTADQWADQAGITNEDNLQNALSMLVEFGVIKETGNGYEAQTESPTLRMLTELNALLNSAHGDDGLETDEFENEPPLEMTLWCPECGERGEYRGDCNKGPVMKCVECEDMFWASSENPPEKIKEYAEELGYPVNS